MIEMKKQKLGNHKKCTQVKIYSKKYNKSSFNSLRQMDRNLNKIKEKKKEINSL